MKRKSPIWIFGSADYLLRAAIRLPRENGISHFVGLYMGESP